MKNIVIGVVCALMLTSCATSVEVVNTESEKTAGMIEIKPVVAEIPNHGYEEELMPTRIQIKKVVAEEKIAKTKPKLKIAKKTKSKPKVKIVKKIKPKVEPKKVVKKPAVKGYIPRTQKVSTPLKTTTTKTIVKSTTKVVAEKSTIKKISFKLSFYTTLPSENGGYSITATGEKLIGLKNTVASNYYPIGIKIYLEGFGTMRVADRGGSNFNSYNRLDVLVQRRSGETNTQYLQRINSMGTPIVEGYIVK